MAAGTMRLLAVLELLQSRRQMTGGEIAERLQVDTRSVRRYIKALQDMGVPIEGERGRYGAYHLDRGFKLPPLMFSENEAVALTLGLMVMRAWQFPIEQSGVAGALAKIERVLPQILVQRMLALQESIHFPHSPPLTNVQSAVVKTLSDAMHHGQRVELSYLSWNNAHTTRRVDPYGIVFHEGWWYMVGYCQLRKELRTFRLDRVQQVERTTEVFARPLGFDPVAHVQKALSNPSGIAAVEVLFHTTLAEAKHALPAEFGTFEAVDNGVLFRRPAYRLEWVAPLLLGLPFPVRIIQPFELKKLMEELAHKAMHMVDTIDHPCETAGAKNV